MNFREDPIGVWQELEEKYPDMTNKKILDTFNTYEFSSVDLIKKIRRINILNVEIKKFLIRNRANVKWSHLTSVLRSKGEVLDKINLKQFKIVTKISELVKLDKKSADKINVFNKYSSEVMTGTNNESIHSNISYFPGVTPGAELDTEGTVPESDTEDKNLSPLIVKGDKGVKLGTEPDTEDKGEGKEVIGPESDTETFSGTVPLAPLTPSHEKVFNKYSDKINFSYKNEARQIEKVDFTLWSVKVLLLSCTCFFLSSILVYQSSKVYSGGVELETIGLLRAIAIDVSPIWLMLIPTKGFWTLVRGSLIVGVFCFVGFTFYASYQTGTSNIKSYIENPEYKRLKESREQFVKERDGYPENYRTRKKSVQAKINVVDVKLTAIEKSSSTSEIAQAGETKAANVFGVQMIIMIISMVMGHRLAHLLHDEKYFRHLILMATSK